MPPRTLRLATAVLLVAEALLVVHPVLAVSNLFVGSGVLGKSLAYVRIGDVVGQGVVFLLSPLLVVLLLLAAWGVAHSARGTGALLLQPWVAVYAGLPLLRPMTVSAPTLAVIAAGTTVVLIVLIGEGFTGPHRPPALVVAGGLRRRGGTDRGHQRHLPRTALRSHGAAHLGGRRGASHAGRPVRT